MTVKKSLKKVLSALLSVTIASLTVLPSFASAKDSISYTKEGFIINKISNPTRGEGEVDGILTGEDEDRGQSYTWSIIEYGDYIYVGTCYNPIYGIYYRNLVTNLTGLVGAQKADEIAKAAIDLIYNGAFYQTTQTNPAIIKVNKKTYEPEIVYRAEDNSNRDSGYRMAAEFNGKLYFVSYGFPKSSLLEIDPENNDESKEVYSTSLKDPTVANGIRGLLALDDKLIMSLTTDEDGTPGVKMLSTSDPSSGNWKEIANQQTFDDLPACHIRDGINGGGIWDIVEFNNSIYVTMVTSKTDENGVTDKRGFAMYRGDESGDSYTWTQIIGDKSKGAKYSFGLGVDEASAGNIFVYDNHLYIGNYNDPMLDLAEIPNNGNFKPLYNDLYNSINLYRMDTNENIELIGGMANEEFPVVKGNLGQGLGSVFNQYVWRYEEYNGKLYVGTYDTSTLTNGFTQLTNGDLLKMTPEEFLQKMKYLKTLLESLKDIKSNNLEENQEISEEETEEVVEETEEVVEDIEENEEISQEDTKEPESTEEVDGTEEKDSTQDISETEEIDDTKDIEEKTEEVKDADAIEEKTEDEEEKTEDEDKEINDITETEENSLIDNLSLEDIDMIEDIGEDNIDQLINDLESVIDKTDGKTSRTALNSNGVEKTIVDDFNDLVAKYDKISNYIPSSIKKQIDKILKNETIENFVYYLGINNYCKNADKGFDLLVSSDGVNFKAITTNGFNDKYNHGVRGFVSTEEGLFIGTANPFYGTQLWKLNEDGEVVGPNEPDDESTYSVTIKYEITGETDIEIPEDTVVTGLKGGQSYDLTEEYNLVKEELLKAGFTVVEEPICTGSISKDNVELKAVFKAPEKENPEDPENPGDEDGENTDKPGSDEEDPENPGDEDDENTDKPGSDEEDPENPGDEDDENTDKPGNDEEDPENTDNDDDLNGDNSNNVNNNNNTSGNSSSSVQTGDNSKLILYSATGIIAAAGLFLVRRKYK